jgi:hypothetical protein
MTCKPTLAVRLSQVLDRSQLQGRDRRCLRISRDIDYFLQTRYTKRDVLARNPSIMERVQRHLRGLAARVPHISPGLTKDLPIFNELFALFVQITSKFEGAVVNDDLYSSR